MTYRAKCNVSNDIWMNTACPCPNQEPDGGWAGRSDQRPQAGAGGGLLAQQNIIQELEVLRSSTSDLDLEDLRLRSQRVARSQIQDIR